MNTVLAASSGAVSPLAIWFYALSIAALVIGGAVAAAKAIAGWGEAMGVWKEQLRVTKELQADFHQHIESDDERFSTVHRRIDALMGRRVD